MTKIRPYFIEVVICKICVDYQLGKMNIWEAYKNLDELTKEDPHKEEVLKLLWGSIYQGESFGDDFSD